jgi:hypothetical protein
LHRGIDGTVLLPHTLPNEFVLLGGKMQKGDIDATNIYDLFL